MARVYMRLQDDPETGTVYFKLVANPPRDEWDPDNLTPAQALALVGVGAMTDVSDDVTPEFIGEVPEAVPGGN